jgi:hypothetical protein
MVQLPTISANATSSLLGSTFYLPYGVSREGPRRWRSMAAQQGGGGPGRAGRRTPGWQRLPRARRRCRCRSVTRPRRARRRPPSPSTGSGPGTGSRPRRRPRRRRRCQTCSSMPARSSVIARRDRAGRLAARRSTDSAACVRPVRGRGGEPRRQAHPPPRRGQDLAAGLAVGRDRGAEDVQRRVEDRQHGVGVVLLPPGRGGPVRTGQRPAGRATHVGVRQPERVAPPHPPRRQPPRELTVDRRKDPGHVVMVLTRVPAAVTHPVIRACRTQRPSRRSRPNGRERSFRQ